MKKFSKSFIFLLILCIIMSNAPKTNAEVSLKFESEALQLYQLGLLMGISETTFIPDLGARFDRQLGIVLLLNFFGKKNDVMSLPVSEINKILAPFTDQNQIVPWARPYLAYAVSIGMISGTSPTNLSPSQSLVGKAYSTMILRIMGYTIEGSQYATSVDILGNLIGFDPNQTILFCKEQYIKDDAVGLAYASLFAQCSDGEVLIEKLIKTGVVIADKAYSQKIVRYNSPNNVEVIKSTLYDIKKIPVEFNMAYYMIMNAMLQGVSQIILPINSYTDTPKEVFNIIETVLIENPEILYYTGCTYSTNGVLTLKYSYDSNTIKTHNKLLKEKINEILTKIITPGMTAYEKELAIHDYIIDNCQYDLGLGRTGISSESYNAYGALCLKKAVCEGYAEAAMLLLTRAGVDSIIITGMSQGVGHAWNMVLIDGKYYHLDITWDDPVMKNGEMVKTYHYFNLSDNSIGSSHVWNNTEYPECEAVDFNYYTYNQLVVASQNEFVKTSVDLVRSGESKITLKISNYNTTDFNIYTAVGDICKTLGQSCSYSFNENQGIADISFE